MKNEAGRPAQNTYEIEVSTVHDALAESRLSREARGPMENICIREHSEIKALAQKICKTNSTTISDYLRACLKALVKDYAGSQVVEKIETEAG